MRSVVNRTVHLPVGFIGFVEIVEQDLTVGGSTHSKVSNNLDVISYQDIQIASVHQQNTVSL